MSVDDAWTMDAEWCLLIARAENNVISDGISEITHNIEVAKVLGVGYWDSKPPEVAVVEDTNGKVWLIPETTECRGGRKGLVSRHDVAPGMRFLLVVKKEVRIEFTTEAYPLNTGAK